MTFATSRTPVSWPKAASSDATPATVAYFSPDVLLGATSLAATVAFLVASMLLMDADIVATGASNAGERGKTPENTPRRTASLFAEYRLPQVAGLSLNAGVYHVGKRAVNNLNQAWVGSYTTLSLGQLKVMQEVITIAVFVPFAILYMKQPLKLDFLWAGLCLVGAAYFAFRGSN